MSPTATGPSRDRFESRLHSMFDAADSNRTWHVKIASIYKKGKLRREFRLTVLGLSLTALSVERPQRPDQANDGIEGADRVLGPVQLGAGSIGKGARPFATRTVLRARGRRKAAVGG